MSRTTTEKCDWTYSETLSSPTATGSGTATATLNGVAVGTAVSADTSIVTYTPGAADASHSTLSPATASITADGASTQVITVQARDVNDNDETAGGEVVVFSLVGIVFLSGTTHDNLHSFPTRRSSDLTATGSGTATATLNGVAVGTAVSADTSIVTYTPGAADASHSTDRKSVV